MNVHDSVEVPDPPVTPVGFNVHAELSDPSATTLLKPFTGETVTVEVPLVLAATVKVVGFAAMVKSGRPVIVKATAAE